MGFIAPVQWSFAVFPFASTQKVSQIFLTLFKTRDVNAFSLPGVIHALHVKVKISFHGEKLNK